jgi:hypothetical protein
MTRLSTRCGAGVREAPRHEVAGSWALSGRECAGRRDALGAIGGGKEPVVADAVKVLGQHVQQEAPDELVRVKPNRLPAVGAADAIILPAERNRIVVGCNEAEVRDGDTMGVTGEIAQLLLGPCERRLAIDHPFDASRRSDEALERPLVGESGMGVEELQLAGVVRMHEHRQHLAPEQARQHLDMHEEVGARGDPSRVIERKPSARHDHPWQNDVAERLIGSIRLESVDHMIVLGEAHLRRILKSYARYCIGL